MGKRKQSLGSKKTTSTAKVYGMKSNLVVSDSKKSITELYKNWRDRIIYSDLNTDNFVSETIIIVESAPLCCPLLDGFIEETKLIDQSKIRTISYDDIYNLVYGHISMENFSSFIATTLKKAIGEAKSEMKVHNFISAELQALLVKLQMIIIRDQYVSHKENYNALQKAISNERDAFLLPLIPNRVSKSPVKNKSKKVKPKKDKKTKKDKSIPLGDPCDYVNKDLHYPMSDEIRRKMKSLKQSEDFVESYEGTDLYFALTKLYDQKLLVELSNIGISTISLIDMAINESDFTTIVSHKKPFETSDTTKVRSLDISNFWRAYGLADGNQLFSIPPEMCYLRYCPPNVTANYTLVYDDLLRIVQNITDLKRQHVNYLDNVKLLDISADKPPMKIQSLQTYNRILSHVPNECQSVPVILHALIEEVSERVPSEYSTVGPYNIDSARKPKFTKKHGGTRQQVLNLFRLHEQDEYKDNDSNITHYETIRVSYGNVINYMFGFTSFSEDLKNINVKALKSIKPLTLFENYFKLNMSDTLMYNYLFQKWSNNFEEITISQLKHCLHSYLFKHGEFHTNVNTSINKQISTVQDLLFSKLKPYNQISENKPKVHLTFLLSSFIRERLRKIKTPSQILQRLEYCEHFEEYDQPTMLQMLNTAYDNMKCFDYKFFAPHDAMLFRFHPGCTRLEYGKSSAICTGICFRDFCAYIVPVETDWLLDQEKLYWEIKATEEEKINEISLDDLYVFQESDFIRAGSIQNKQLQEQLALEKAAQKKTKTTNPTKTSKSSSKKKREKNPETGTKKKKGSTKEVQDVKQKKKKESKAWKTSIEATLQIKPLCIKQYSYEGYDLSSNYYELQHSTKQYSSIDGISVTVDKQQWINDKTYCSVKLSINDNNLIFHCLQKNIISASQPFLFHLNLSNGIIMTISSPLDGKNRINLRGKPIRIYEHLNTDTNMYPQTFSTRSKTLSFSTRSKNRRSYMENTMSSIQNNKYLQTKREIIQKIREAARSKIPIFKICSSRLHKYQYVKRIKSHIEVPFGKIIKRFVLRPKMHIHGKRKLIMSQCIPALVMEKSRITPDLSWETTLPTGLWIQSVPGTEQDPLYIKQGYLIDRLDINTIQDEYYRICFQGRVLSFRKTGDVLSMVFNRSIGLHHYDYLSSNLSELNSTHDQLSKSKDLPSFHKASKDIPQFERKIQKICKKYKTRLIGLSENYRLISKREKLRKEHKTYKITKAIYKNTPSLLPHLKYTMVIGDGEKYSVDGHNFSKEENKFYSTTYNDYLKRETLIYRQDGTSWFLDNKGYATTQFPDNTRITTWASILDESFILELSDSDTSKSSNTTKTSTNTGSNKFNRITTLDSTFLISQNSTSNVQYSKGSSLLNDSHRDLLKRNMVDDSSYVLIGMNYKYQHPNYMPVTQYCIDGRFTVDLPDGFSATIFKEGSYRVNFQKGEIVDIDKKYVTLQTDSCDRCHTRTKCKLNIQPLYSKLIKKEIKPKNTFLYMEDRENKIIRIDFGGNLTEEFGSQESLYSICDCDKPIIDRYFVLNRDFTGTELFIRPKPNRFICTLNYFDAPPETNSCNITKYNCTSIMQQLFTTYSEHFMTLYDTPMLGLENNMPGTEEIYRTFHYDRRNVMELRAPMFIYERTIYHLSFAIVLKSLVAGFYNYLHSKGIELPLQPTSSLFNLINEQKTPEEALPAVISRLPTTGNILFPYDSKFKNFRSETHEFKKLLYQTKPMFFEIVRGIMFQIVHECVEKALDNVEMKAKIYSNFAETSNADIADGSLLSINGEAFDIITPFVSELFDIASFSTISNHLLSPRSISFSACDHIIDNESESQSKYNLTIPRPKTNENVIMHLKPNCPIYDVIVTGKNIKIVTDKKMDEVPVSIYGQQGADFKGHYTIDKEEYGQKHASTKDGFIILDHLNPYEIIKYSKTNDLSRSGKNWKMSNSFRSYRSKTSIDIFTNSPCHPGTPMPSTTTCTKSRTGESFRSIDGTVTEADSHQVDAKIIAKNIIGALVDATPSNSILNLSRIKIRQIIYNELQFICLQNKDANAVVEAIESWIFSNTKEPEDVNILDIAIGLLNEIKHNFELEKTSQETTKMYTFLELEDLAVRVSVILYRVHENDSKEQIMQEIEELISTYQLSKSNIELVLNLTVKGLKEDFKSSPMDITEYNISDMALQILGSIDTITDEVINQEKGSKLFWPEFSSNLRPKSNSKDSEQLQNMTLPSPFNMSEIKNYLTKNKRHSSTKNKNTVHKNTIYSPRRVCGEAGNSHQSYHTCYVNKTKVCNRYSEPKQKRKTMERGITPNALNINPKSGGEQKILLNTTSISKITPKVTERQSFSNSLQGGSNLSQSFSNNEKVSSSFPPTIKKGIPSANHVISKSRDSKLNNLAESMPHASKVITCNKLSKSKLTELNSPTRLSAGVSTNNATTPNCVQLNLGAISKIPTRCSRNNAEIKSRNYSHVAFDKEEKKRTESFYDTTFPFDDSMQSCVSYAVTNPQVPLSTLKTEIPYQKLTGVVKHPPKKRLADSEVQTGISFTTLSQETCSKFENTKTESYQLASRCSLNKQTKCLQSRASYLNSILSHKYDMELKNISRGNKNTGKRVLHDDKRSKVQSIRDRIDCVNKPTKRSLSLPQFVNMCHAQEPEQDIDAYKNTTKLRSIRYAGTNDQKHAIDVNKNEPEILFLLSPTIKDPRGYNSRIGKLKSTPYQYITKQSSHENKPKPKSSLYKDNNAPKSNLYKNNNTSKTTSYADIAKQKSIPYAHWNTLMTCPESPPLSQRKLKVNPHEDTFTSKKFQFGTETKLTSTIYAENERNAKRIQGNSDIQQIEKVPSKTNISEDYCETNTSNLSQVKYLTPMSGNSSTLLKLLQTPTTSSTYNY